MFLMRARVAWWVPILGQQFDCRLEWMWREWNKVWNQSIPDQESPPSCVVEMNAESWGNEIRLLLYHTGSEC